MAKLKNTEITDNGFLKVPAGSNSQRPSNPESGMLRYNTDLNSLEEYDGSVWKLYLSGQTLENSVSQASSVDQAVSFIGDGAIVESDSNSDGEYTRWSDGTQIVHYVDTSQGTTSNYPYTSGSADDTNSSGIWFGLFLDYPKPFNSDPVVVNGQENPGSRSSSSSAELGAYTVHERGTSGAFLRYLDFTGNSGTCYPTYIAVGTWQ